MDSEEILIDKAKFESNEVKEIIKKLIDDKTNIVLMTQRSKKQ